MKKIFKWYNVRLWLMLLGVVSLFSFGKSRNNSRNLSQTKVEFVGNEPLFITPESVNKLLIENKPDASAIQKVALDLKSLEEVLTQNAMVEEAEVYVTIDGVLKAIVKQKTPIARYAHLDETYYIDSQGGKMPLSEVYSARVPLVTGDEKMIFSAAVQDVLMLIHEDEFLRKDIIGVEVEANGNMKMESRGFQYEIDFGKPVRGNEKFRKYKAFLQKATKDSSIYNYKRLDLRFDNQVVCTK